MSRHGRHERAVIGSGSVTIEDRYGGAYSGGKYLCIKICGEAILDGASWDDDDTICGDFWREPPKWIAVGDTPLDAFVSLRWKQEHDE